MKRLWNKVCDWWFFTLKIHGILHKDEPANVPVPVPVLSEPENTSYRIPRQGY